MEHLPTAHIAQRDQIAQRACKTMDVRNWRSCACTNLSSSTSNDLHVSTGESEEPSNGGVVNLEEALAAEGHCDGWGQLAWRARPARKDHALPALGLGDEWVACQEEALGWP